MPQHTCRIDFALHKLPDLGLLSGTVQGVRHVHPHRDSGDGSNDFSFHLNVSGLSVVAGRQGETTLQVASRHRISDSYIRKLFESEGTTFSQFALNRRLVYAHRMLTDQRWADRSIAGIAFEVGFGDLSYFNRTFKRLYGATPSELRPSSRKDG